MTNRIYIEIETREDLWSILKDARGKGLLKDVQIDNFERSMERKEFPIRVPVELDNLWSLLGNPIIRKMFGSKVDKAVSTCLQKVTEAG